MGRKRLARMALVGNAMAWVGAAGFVLAIAGEHLDALTGGSLPRLVGFGLLLVVGAGLLIAGVLDHHRIRAARPSGTRPST